jgi:hypothetical protein
MSTDEKALPPSLIEFLRLEASARAAGTISDLGFVIANETHRLVSFRQAFFCPVRGGKLVLDAISGLAGVDRQAPFYDWFVQFGRYLDSQSIDGEPRIFSKSDFPHHIQVEWADWLPSFVVIIALKNRDSQVLAYLILAREETFSEEELKALQSLAQVYGHALSAFPTSRQGYRRFVELATHRPFLFGVVTLLVILLFIPVRQSSLGQAEVTPLTYNSITSPLDGVIALLLVKPNERVHKGQILFRLDDTTIRNRLESAHRTMSVAKSEEFLSLQKSFVDQQSRGELATQEARVREKGSAISYMREMLDKMEVRAPSDGIVLFGDPTDWEGKPVTTGERVMMLADEQSAGITVWLPASDAVTLEPGRRVRLFLHTAPLKPREGIILRSSYQPVLSPDGIASYRVTAEFAAGTEKPRLGMKGTAKVYGDRVSLGYYLFRRPLAAVRQRLGW